MGFKLFDQVDLSTEDMGLNEPLDIDVVIATQEALADIADIEKQCETTANSIDLAETITANMNAQVATEEAVLATPEAITASTVILSQESILHTAMLLGAEDTLASISVESIEANPVTSLELSIEEKKSLIARIVETIKIGFAKFINMIKKIYVKAVVAMTGIEKQAKTLRDKLKDDKKKAAGTIKITDDVSTKIGKKLGAPIKAFGPLENGKYIEFMTDTATMDTLEKLFDTMSKGSDHIKNSFTKGEKITGAELTTMMYDSSSEMMKEEGLVVRVEGRSITTLRGDFKKLKALDPKEKFSRKDATAILTDMTFSIQKKETGDLGGFTSVSYDSLIKIMDDLKKPSGKLDKFVSANKKLEGKITKRIEKIGKKEEDIAELPLVKFGNVIATKVSLDRTLGYINGMKNIMFYVSTLANAAEGIKKKNAVVV